MNQQEQSNASADEQDNSASLADRTTWYKRVDSLAHKVQGVQTVNLILLAWVITSGGVSFNNALSEQNNTYSQMHAVLYHGSVGAPPAHYASMDWIMTTTRVMLGVTVVFVAGTVSHELCIDSKDKSCNLVWWQMHEGYNTSSATQLLIPPSVINKQAYFYRSKRVMYLHLHLMFTCLAEKIRDVDVYQSNKHS